MRKLLRQRLAEIESLGFKIRACEQTRGSHFKVRLAAGDATKTIVVASSPSCVRSDRNFSANLRRLKEQI